MSLSQPSQHVQPIAHPEDLGSEPAKEWDFEPGEEIVPGRHALERLGGGHDYEAYLAWDDGLFSLVVAKLIRPHLVEDEHALRSLAREADVLQGLAHPVLARGFGAELEGPRPHIVMEHLEGPPLASTLRRFGPLDIEQLLPLGFQIASALQYLANRQVVHLDVKPRNIILGAPPRLIDLSVARSFDAAGRITAPIGTDPYMAPEQCDPQLARIGSPADVWGLGATLHHAVSGHLPFPREKEYDPEDLQERFPQLGQPPLPLPGWCPEELVDLISDCLAFDPSERPAPAKVALALEPMIERIPRRRILGRGRPRIR